MPGMTVEYIVGLLDKFSPVADRVMNSSRKTMEAVDKMGMAATTAEGRFAKLGTAVTDVTTGIMNRAKAAADSVLGIGAAATKSAKEVDAAGLAMNRALNAPVREKYGTRVDRPGAADRLGGHEEAARGSRKSRGVYGAGVGSGLMHSYFVAQMAKGVMHGVDELVGVPAEVDTLLKKLDMGGVSKAGQDAAMSRATELSKKHPNMSVTEALQTIVDLRGSITGSFDQILKDADPFVKLGGFLKAYQGGKHASEGKALEQELQAAMMSGEFRGKITGEQLEKVTDQLAAMKIVYGDKLDIKRFLTMQRAAGSSTMGMDDDFVYGMLPALTQSMGPRAGTGLMTLTGKILAGISNRPQAIAFGEKYGLIDPSKVAVDSKGKPTGALDFGAFKDTQLAGRNPFKWAEGPLLDFIEKAVKDKGGTLPVAAMRKAIDAGDSDAYAKVIQGIKPDDMNKMKWALGQLLRDRTAVNETIETILQGPKLLKDTGLMLQTRKDLQAFQNYDEAKQEVVAKATNLWVKLTGKDFVPAVSGALRALGRGLDILGREVDFVRANKRFDLLHGPANSPLSNFLSGPPATPQQPEHAGFSSLRAVQQTLEHNRAVSAHAEAVIAAAHNVKVHITPSVAVEVTVKGVGIESGRGSANLPISATHPQGRAMATPTSPMVPQ